MTMAEGQEGLLKAMGVGDAPQNGTQQPGSYVQEEKLHISGRENKLAQPMKICRDKAQEKVESGAIMLPVGCKVSPKSEDYILFHTGLILHTMGTYSPPVDDSVQNKCQIYQNVCVNSLKDILENTCKLLREGHRNSRELIGSIAALDTCCTTSAAVRRALLFPGIIPLLKDFIDTYMIAFIDTPFLRTDQLRSLALSITAALCMVGKFVVYSKTPQSEKLLTWWKAIEELYWGRSWVVLSNAKPHRNKYNNYDGLEFVCRAMITVSESIKLMQAKDPPLPCDIMRDLNHTKRYVVFCSSLQCPIFAEKDAVLFYCARCKLAAYCSRRCQRAHWKQGHREKCWKITWDF